MVDPTIFYVILLFAHFVGDFACQTRYMADNKSKSFAVLALHVSVYTAVLGTVSAWQDGLTSWFLPANFALHFVTDAVTSRMTSYFWREKRVKAFFTVIGFDQFLHAAALLLTAKYLLFGG